MMKWPPLIVVAPRERWKAWRDVILTLFIWAGFLYIFVDQSIHFWSSIHHVQVIYPGAFVEHWDFRLKPFAILVAVLCLWLFCFGIHSLRNWRRVTQEPVPPALPLGTEAVRHGMSEEAILAAREMKVAVISLDESGRYSARASAADPI